MTQTTNNRKKNPMRITKAQVRQPVMRQQYMALGAEKEWSPIHTCLDFSRSQKNFTSVKTLDVSWWILFRFYLFSVCDLAVEKLEFQLVLNFSLLEKSTQVWIGLEGFEKLKTIAVCRLFPV